MSLCCNQNRWRWNAYIRGAPTMKESASNRSGGSKAQIHTRKQGHSTKKQKTKNKKKTKKKTKSKTHLYSGMLKTSKSKSQNRSQFLAGSGAHQTSYPMGTVRSFPGG
jgi:hypothetical protein